MATHTLPPLPNVVPGSRESVVTASRQNVSPPKSASSSSIAQPLTRTKVPRSRDTTPRDTRSDTTPNTARSQIPDSARSRASLSSLGTTSDDPSVPGKSRTKGSTGTRDVSRKVDTTNSCPATTLRKDASVKTMSRVSSVKKMNEPEIMMNKLNSMKATLLDVQNLKGHKQQQGVEKIASVMFDIIDFNNSGFIDKHEAKRFQDILHGNVSLWNVDFFALDENGDSRITKDEIGKYLINVSRKNRKLFACEMILVIEMLKGYYGDLGGEVDRTFQDLTKGAGCVIPLVEERGLLRSQLKKLVAHMQRRCNKEQWVDRSERSATYNQRLEPNLINLYQAVDWVVKPATKERMCSYIEVVANAPQKPRWFVSHWWGESVVEFMACLDQHSKDRQLESTDPYWVCAYANNQWELAGDLVEDPKDSSFRRAMNMAEGTISILDKDAVCYNRIWCCYEVWVSTSAFAQAGSDKKQYLYDAYTCNGSNCVGLTDGIAEIDMDDSDNEDAPASLKAMAAKMEREKLFPVELSRLALNIRLQDAQASQEADKYHILNSIAGRKNLNAVPLENHESYDQCNTNLHGRLAISSLRVALERGMELKAYLEAIRCSNLSGVELSFFDCQAFKDDHVRDVCTSFASDTDFVKLDFSHCFELTDASLKNLAAGVLKLTSMKELSLNMTCCRDITDDGLVDLGAAFNQTPSLTSVSLNFFGCNKVGDVGVCTLVMNLPHKITHLTLDLSFTKVTEKTLAEMEANTDTFSNLEELILKLHCTSAVTQAGMTSLVKVIPATVRKLSLDLRYGEEATDDALRALAEGIPKSLQDLHVSLMKCEALTDDGIEALAMAIPLDLQTLSLEIGRIPNLGDASVKSIGRYIPQELKDLSLKLTDLDQVTMAGMERLVEGMPKSLHVLRVWVDHCTIADESCDLITKKFAKSDTDVKVIGRNYYSPCNARGKPALEES